MKPPLPAADTERAALGALQQNDRGRARWTIMRWTTIRTVSIERTILEDQPPGKTLAHPRRDASSRTGKLNAGRPDRWPREGVLEDVRPIRNDIASAIASYKPHRRLRPVVRHAFAHRHDAARCREPRFQERRA